MHSVSELSAQHCRPLEGESALTSEAVSAYLSAFPEWKIEGEFITRTYAFGNYYETLAFVNALAWVVHKEDHHPELLVTYNRCKASFNTHSVGGISLNDFICAAKSDALYAAAA